MKLEAVFPYVLVGSTSLVIFLLGVMQLRLKPVTLLIVIREMTECVGAFTLFFGINSVIGVAAVILIRRTFGFFTMYAVTDPLLIVLSAFQGVVFQLWWRRSRG